MKTDKNDTKQGRPMKTFKTTTHHHLKPGSQVFVVILFCVNSEIFFSAIDTANFMPSSYLHVREFIVIPL